MTRPQKYLLRLLIVAEPILLVLRPRCALIIAIGLITALYFVTGVYKIWLLIRGERADASMATDTEPIASDDVPVYTVLVPLHREGRILPVLVERLKLIDYPPDRLQILLLIEMDDEETQRAARHYPLPRHIRPTIMPPGQPRTKPRALNVGLHAAEGNYIVIYDAEDRPEPDQLRKAVAAFKTLPPDVVCVQGRLNFYNRYQSLLTRLFAVDYATWYDQLLPGLANYGRLRSSAFVPLGGTSNHFRVEILRQVGGWDPFNVTEDCDLGARLGRTGLRVAMLDSTTWEEAVPRVRPWIKQRSRWVKGYLQTYLVHMRHPVQLWSQLGPLGFIDFQMLVGGSSLVLLANPLAWALMLAYIGGSRTPVDSFIQTLFPAPLYYASLLSLVMGNFIFFYCNIYVCVRRNYLDLTRYALLTPVYWLLMSLGAWSGLISLVLRPYYWAKTEHGVSLSSAESVAPAYELSDEQWKRLKPLLPEARGEPRVRDIRQVINGILWREKTGITWRELPERYGPWRTVASRYYRWVRTGVWVSIVATLREQQGEHTLALDGDSRYMDHAVAQAQQHAAGVGYAEASEVRQAAG